MAYCGVLVGVQSKLSLSGWYREATKFLQIVGRDGALWLTLSGGVPDSSGNGPSLSDPNSTPSEENRLRALFPQSEESWRLGEGGDLLEVDAMPGHSSALHLTVRRSVFKLGGIGRSETWSFSVPCKALFLAQLVDCGVPVPFKAGQVPGVALGPNNETDLQGVILPVGFASASGLGQAASNSSAIGGDTRPWGLNSSNFEEVAFLFEATTMRAVSRARGDTVVSFAVKDIESVGFVTDLEPGGFSVTHAGYPQVHVFRAQSAGHRDAVLAGLEARALLLGRSLEPFGALELHELAPPPPVQNGHAFHATRVTAGSGGSGGNSVRGVAATQGGGGASVELNLTARTLVEVTLPGIANDVSSLSRSSNRHVLSLNSSGSSGAQQLQGSGGSRTLSGMHGRALTSVRPLSSLVAVVLPPGARPQDVMLQWANGFTVCYDLGSAAACAAFLVSLLDRCAAPAAGCHCLPPPILASSRLWPLRAIPWPAVVPANNSNNSNSSSWILAAEAYYVHRLCAAAVDATVKLTADAENDSTSSSAGQVAVLPLHELEVFLANMPRRAPPPLLLQASNESQRIAAGPVQALTSKVAGSVAAAANSVTDLVSTSTVDSSALSRCVELAMVNLCYGTNDGDVERCANLCSSLVLLLGHAHAFKSITTLRHGDGDDANDSETAGGGAAGDVKNSRPHSPLFRALVARLLALTARHPAEIVATVAADALAALLTFRGGVLPSAHMPRIEHSNKTKGSPRNSGSSFRGSSDGGAVDPLVSDAEQRHRDILLLSAFPDPDGLTDGIADGKVQGAALLGKALKLRASAGVGTSHGAAASLAVSPLLRAVCSVALFGVDSTATTATALLSPQQQQQQQQQQPQFPPAASPRSALLAAVADNALFLSMLGAGAPPAWGCAAELLMTEVTRVDDDATARATAAALAARRAQQQEAWHLAVAQHKAEQEARVQRLYVEAAQAAARTGRPPPAYNTFVENLAQSSPPSPPLPPPPTLSDQFDDTESAEGGTGVVPRQQGFRTRMQAAALRDGSYLRHLARAALGTMEDGHSSTKGNNNMVHGNNNGGYSGGSSTSAFLVSVWSAGSPDALSLLARCLPVNLLNVLWDSNPLVPEMLKASKLRAVKRLLRGEVTSNDKDTSNDSLDNEDAETTDDESNNYDEDNDDSATSPLSSATVAAVATWLGPSLSRRRWALLWDLTRCGQVDCPSLVWHATARADFSRALTSQVWALDRAQAAAATTSTIANASGSGGAGGGAAAAAGKSPSPKKGAVAADPVAVAWNFSEFEVVYPSLSKERSVEGLSLRPLCNLKSASAVRNILSRAAATAAAAADAAGAPNDSERHGTMVSKFVRHFAEEMLQIALLDPQPLTQRLVLSALDKVVRAFANVASVTEGAMSTGQVKDDEEGDGATRDFPSEGILVNWAFPNMVVWCVKLLDATSDRAVFERCLSLLHALLHAAPLANGRAALTPLREPPGDGRRYAYDRQGTTGDEVNAEGKSSDIQDTGAGGEAQAGAAGALAVVASLVHRRDALSDAAALSKFAVNKRPVSAGPAAHQVLPQLTSSSSSSSSSSSLLTQSASTGEQRKASGKGVQSNGEVFDEDEDEGKEDGIVVDDSPQDEAQNSASKEEDAPDEDEGVWYYLSPGQSTSAGSSSDSSSCHGPCTVDQLRALLESGAITRRTKVAPKSAATSATPKTSPAAAASAPDASSVTAVTTSAPERAAFRPLSSVRQLRWTLLLQGPRTKSNAELCLLALDSLLVLASAHKEGLGNNTKDDSHTCAPVVWPPPLGVLRCASPLVLPHIAQCLLAVGRPLVVDAAAKLLLCLAQVLNTGPLAACMGSGSASPLDNRGGSGNTGDGSSGDAGRGTGGGGDGGGSGQMFSSGALGGPKLYTTGAFYFCLSYRGSNLQHIAQLLKAAHAQQRLPHGGPPGGVGADSEGSDKATPAARSVLRPLLPDAMLHFLANYSASAFADTFLSDADTPEAKWTPRMRFALADTVDQHLSEGLNDEEDNDGSGEKGGDGGAVHSADHSTDKLRRRLAQDTLFRYEFVPMPPVRYPDLERELYCQGYYLGNLCAYSARFPGEAGGWPLRQPVAFLKALLSALAKVHTALRAPPSLTNTDALRVLGFLPKDQDDDKATANSGTAPEKAKASSSNTRPSAKELRKAYHALAREWHPDKNPSPTARVRFQEVQRAYEALAKDALSYEDTACKNQNQDLDGSAAGKSDHDKSSSSSSSSGGHSSSSSGSAKEPHASYELRLILECHALLFAQHGALLCQYRYPSYPLLLSFFGSGVSSHETNNPSSSSSSSGSSSSNSQTPDDQGLATCPVTWLTLVARVLLATAGGTFGKGNPGNARALCVDARGGAACALVLRRALSLVSEASTAIVSAQSNYGTSSSGSSAPNESNSGFTLLTPLLGLLCGPFAGLPDFKAFLEAPTSISGKEKMGVTNGAKNDNSSGLQASNLLSGGSEGLGMGCVQDLCKCLSLASQKPELVTLVLRGILKLLCLPLSAAAIAASHAATSNATSSTASTVATIEDKNEESESERCEDLGHRLLICPGFFATLLDFLLRYDSSLPLPRSAQKKIPTTATAAPAAAADAADSGGAPAVNESNAGVPPSNIPLQLASNHHALLALRIFRQLASPNNNITATATTTTSSSSAAVATTASGVRVALQALLPGDLAWAVLGLERSTKVSLASNAVADPSELSPERSVAHGVALLGDSGPSGVDSQAIVDATVVSSSQITPGGGIAKLEDEQCIDANEEAALVALNAPADTPLVKWTGDLQAKLLADFCAPRIGWNAPSEAPESESESSSTSLSPPVLVAASSFRYSELKDEVTVKGVFLRAFVEQHKDGGSGSSGVVSSEVSRRTCDDNFANALFRVLQGQNNQIMEGAAPSTSEGVESIVPSKPPPAAAVNLSSLERAAQHWAVRALHTRLMSPHSPPPQNSIPFGNPSHLAIVLDRFWQSLEINSPSRSEDKESEDTWSLQLALRLVAHPAGARALAGSPDVLSKCLAALHLTSATAITSSISAASISDSSSAGHNAAATIGSESDGSWVQQASALALVTAACRASDDCCSQVLERGGLLDLLALAMPPPTEASSAATAITTPAIADSGDGNDLGHKVRATAVEALSVLCNGLSFGGAAVDALSIFLPAYFVEMLLALVHKMPVAIAADHSDVVVDSSGGSASSKRIETSELLRQGRRYRASSLLLSPSSVAVDFLSMLDRDHSNPELQWSSAHRHELRRRVADVIKTRQLSLSGASSLSFWQLLDSVRVRFSLGKSGGSSGSSVVCGKVDVPLFLANPSFELRDPETFLRALMDTLCQDQQVVEDTASAGRASSSSTGGGGGGGGADTDTSDEEGPAGGAGGARAAAASARAAHLCARAVVALLEHSPDAPRLQACAASLKLALPLARVLLAPITCAQTLRHTEQESLQAEAAAKAASPGASQEQENTRAGAAAARRRGAKRRARAALRRADDAALVVGALCGHSPAVAEQCLHDPVARVNLAISKDVAESSDADAGDGSSLATSSVTVKMGVLGALATAAAPTALVPSLPTATPESNQPSVATFAALTAAAGKERSWSATALRLGAIASLIGPMSEPGAASGTGGQQICLPSGSTTAAGLEEFCAQALHSGLAAVCVTIVDSADSQPTSTTSSTSSSSNPGGGGGESSSDNDDDEDDIFGEGSEQSASSPAQARVAAQVHALAILQALDAASTQTTPPSLSSSSTGNKGGSSGYNGGNSTTARTAVATILAGSDGWRRARGQRHDLMMVNASVTGYLTN